MLFGSLAIVLGLATSFHAGTAGGATAAGSSVAQFFAVLVVAEISRAAAGRRRSQPAAV